MDAINLSEITAADRLICARVGEAAGVDFKDCYQCGKCTVGCTQAESMDLMPREVIRYLQLGAHASIASYFTLVSFP